MEQNSMEKIQAKHYEHRIWMNELDFYADEIKIFEHQLEELAGSNIKELLPGVEQFQNNFIRQKEVLDQLRHDIKVHEQALAHDAGAANEVIADRHHDHEASREQIVTFKKIFAELKEDYLQFLRKWH